MKESQKIPEDSKEYGGREESDRSRVYDDKSSHTDAKTAWAHLMSGMRRGQLSDDKFSQKSTSQKINKQVKVSQGGRLGIRTKWGVKEKSEDEKAQWEKRKKAKGKLISSKSRDNPEGKVVGGSAGKSQPSISLFFKAIRPNLFLACCQAASGPGTFCINLSIV